MSAVGNIYNENQINKGTDIEGLIPVKDAGTQAQVVRQNDRVF